MQTRIARKLSELETACINIHGQIIIKRDSNPLSGVYKRRRISVRYLGALRRMNPLYMVQWIYLSSAVKSLQTSSLQSTNFPPCGRYAPIQEYLSQAFAPIGIAGDILSWRELPTQKWETILEVYPQYLRWLEKCLLVHHDDSNKID